MSTASRNCGTVCSARGLGSNAPEVPGVSGKIGRHYDPRAARQLGSLKKTGPKYEPEAETAAHASQGSAHRTTLPRRGARLRHSPPLFPSRNPRQIRRRRDMMNDYRRETPRGLPQLDLPARREFARSWPDRKCLKTHFATHDDWCNYMVAKLRSISGTRRFTGRPRTRQGRAGGVARVYNALKSALAEGQAEKAAASEPNVH